jgi:phage terminase Nu1 subunit (DNA packaging protein)
MSTRSKLVNRQELALALGVHGRTVYAWVREGMPRDPSGLFDLAACRRWRAARDESRADLVRARAGRERAQAELALQTARMRARELVWRADVERTWSAYVTSLKKRLRRIPRQFAPKLVDAMKQNPEGGSAPIAACLDTLVRDLLTELARG